MPLVYASILQIFYSQNDSTVFSLSYRIYHFFSIPQIALVTAGAQLLSSSKPQRVQPILIAMLLLSLFLSGIPLLAIAMISTFTYPFFFNIEDVHALIYGDLFLIKSFLLSLTIPLICWLRFVEKSYYTALSQLMTNYGIGILALFTLHSFDSDGLIGIFAFIIPGLVELGLLSYFFYTQLIHYQKTSSQ